MTTLAPSLERAYASRLDFSAAISAGLVSLTTFQGQSSAALAPYWFGFAKMDKELAQPRKAKPVPSSPEEAAAKLPDQAASLRMKAVRAGKRWSNTPTALKSRRERERLKAKRLGLA